MSELRVLQRVILPGEDDLDVVPLYVETDVERGYDLAAEVRTAESAARTAAVGMTQSRIRYGETAGLLPDLRTRGQAVVAAGQRISFATYFNAFPASYWRRWTVVPSVRLRMRVSGDATVVVYRSTARGQSHPVETIGIDSDEPQAIDLDLPLDRFIDGGWYWFDIAAGTREARLLEADWVAEVPGRPKGTVSIGITTFNRPEFLVELLHNLGGAGDVLELIDTIYVIDQGTKKVSDHPDFPDAAKALGGRLTVIEQPNLGGSGGFSRAMDETVRAGASQYVLLLDDDVQIDPEGILRAVTFADLARKPTLVGGHMFSLHDRSVLHAFGEVIAPYKWWWGAAPKTRTSHDFGRQGLRHTPWLHRRVDVDYNGWWMCLIPTSVVQELGYSLPVFIKWDDAEYGLRAHEAGVPTVSMPGVAVWHVPWDDKNDALDWQAYYHIRNRLISALLHSPYDRGGRVVMESVEVQVQHLLSMQYSTAALRVRALEDVLAGPDGLHAALPRTTGELRQMRANFDDARLESDPENFPPVRRRRPPKRDLTGPTSKVGLFVKAGIGAVRQLTRVPEAAKARPKAALPYQDANWWVLANIDSALVSTADGASTSWYRRDPDLFRRLSTRSAAVHAELLREWPQLAKRYRDAAAELTSPEQWRRTFAGETDGGAAG